MKLRTISSIREIIEKGIFSILWVSGVLWIASLVMIFFSKKVFLYTLLIFFCFFSFDIILIMLWKLALTIEEKKNKEK